MSIVYVTQEQPNKNIIPAQKFGRIQVLLSPNVQVGFSAGQVVQKLYLDLSSFNDDDYLLLIGDPVIIGAATAVACHWNNGKAKLLKWDRQEMQYYPVQIDILHERREAQDGPDKQREWT